MAGRNRLTILVDANTNQAKGQLRGMAGDVSSFAGQIEQAFSLDGAVGALGELSPMLGTVATGAVAVGAAVGGWQLAKGAMDLGRLGASSLDAKRGFNELAQEAGTSGTALMDALQAGSAGAINNQQLMLAANRAMMLDVADSADEMGALMAVAANRGKKLGMDTQSAFNDLVTGLGRASPQILDNLAIMIDSNQVYAQYAQSIGKSASALTDAEKKQALVNSVVAEGRRLMADQSSTTESAALSFERMDAAIQNSKSALGELFAPVIAATAENIARAAEAATTKMVELQDSATADDALDYLQLVGESIRALEFDIANRRLSVNGMIPGSENQISAQRELMAVEFELVNRTRELDAARMHYFATLRQLYPAQDQDAAALNRTSIEAQAAAQAQQILSNSMAGQASAANQATASMDLLGASYDLLVQRSAALEGVNGTLASIASGAVATLGESGALAMYDEMTASVTEQIAAWQAVGQSQAAIRDVLLPAYIQQLQRAADNAVAMAIANGRAATSLEAVHGSALGAAQGLGQASGMFGAVAQAANVAAGQVAAAAQQLDQFIASAAAGMASDLVSTGGAGPAVAYYNAINGQISRQTDIWKSQGYTIDQIQNVLLPGYVSGLRKATSQTVNLASGTRAVGSAAAKVNQEFSDLESKVSSTISGALGDIGGINLDDILPRQDAVGEDARRLADVAVNGFASPWAAYFQKEFPELWAQITASGDIKTGAAQILKDFQDGLRPELIDKDRAKEIVKRAILGDKNTKALTDEIAKELAGELGISIQEAQSAAASALGGGGGILGSLGGSGEASKPTITPTLDKSLLPQVIALPATVEWQTPLPMPDTKDLQVTIAGSVHFAPVDFAAAGLPEMYTLPLALAPFVDWQVTDTETPRTAITEKMPIRLTPTIDWQNVDTATPSTALTEKMVISLTPSVDWQNVDTATPSTALTEKMVISLTPSVDWQNVDTATPATALTEKMVISLTPSVNFMQADVATPLAYFERELAPLVTPYINYLGMPSDQFKNASTYITESIVATVTPYLDTTSDGAVANTLVAGSNLATGIMDAIRAYDLPGAIAFELGAGTGMYNAGATNGQLFASGFLDFFGGNVPASVVNTLFNLVWTKIQSEQSRKAAK